MASADTFRKNVRKCLKELGMTQKELADKIGVRAPNVTAWLSGDVSPQIDSIDKVAGVLGVTTPDLLSDKEITPSRTSITEAQQIFFDKLSDVIAFYDDFDVVFREYFENMLGEYKINAGIDYLNRKD